MSQTTWNAAPAVAIPGMIADLTSMVKVTASVDTTNGRVPAGAFVTIKTAGDPPIVELPNATGEITGAAGLGIVIADTHVQHNDDGLGLENKDECSVLVKGRIWVKSETAVTVPVAAFARFTADANPIGSIRGDADSGEAVGIPGGRLLVPCGVGGLTILEII